MNGRCLNDKIPVEIAENLKDFFPEHTDVSIEDVLAEQESAYHYIQRFQTNGKKNDNSSSSSSSSQAGNINQSSHGAQLALDEALARSLELGDDFEGLCVYHAPHCPMAQAGRIESSNTTEPPYRITSQNPSQADIDPDNMTYEEMQSLGDAVGHESKGLSEDLISRLPTFKYKIGFFSKKKKEECVICCSEYKNGVKLMSLPCAHQYHMECIKRWLELNKSCPVCKVEVTDG